MAAPKNPKQSAAYHGIHNAKYAIREDGAPGKTVVPFAYAKSVSFDPTLEQQAIYANSQKIMAIVSDQGYTGAFGTTAQDRAFESALGQILPVAGGLADINLIGMKRFDMYYEYVEETENGVKYVVKVWALNIEATKSSKAHNTDTNSASIGEYSYPTTVYGDKIKAATGETVYKDNNGNELIATRVICVPGDTGYETFGDTVPVVKMESAGA